MKKPKFKKGDKVKVLRASTDVERDLWGDEWVESMNETIGKIYTIRFVFTWPQEYGYIYPIYTFEEFGLNFPEFVLQDVMAGKQLEFDFMK